jgi:FkbM family methyltransferase
VKKLLQFTTPEGRPYFLRVDLGADPYHEQAAIDGAFNNIPRLLWRLLSPGSVFFDLGANIGTISIPMAAKGAVVHAFDILPENIAAIQAAATATGVDVITHELAVWSSDRELSAGGESAWGKIVENGSRKVRAVYLDGFCRRNRIDRIDVVKVDIEGSELAAFKGMRKTLAKHQPDVVFESNVHCINGRYSYNDIFRLLKSCGYRFYRIWQDSLSPFAMNGFQEAVCCDYLASTRAPGEIEDRTGFPIIETAAKDQINSIVSQDRLTDVHRLYAYSVMDRAPTVVRNDPEIRSLIAKWKALALADPDHVGRLKAGAAPRLLWFGLFRRNTIC